MANAWPRRQASSRLQRSRALRRDPRPPAVPDRRAGGLPHRHLHPGAGHQPGRGGALLRRPLQHHPRDRQHVLRRRAVAPVDLRHGRHALHLRLDHHPDDVDGGALAAWSCARKASPAGARSPSTRATARWGWRCSSPSPPPARCEKGGLTLIHGWPFMLTATITMTTGTMFLMWLGEQITERGIGNGISMIILSGIVAGLPGAVGTHLRVGEHRRNEGSVCARADRPGGRRDHASWCSSSARSGASRSTTPSARWAGACMPASRATCRSSSTCRA